MIGDKADLVLLGASRRPTVLVVDDEQTTSGTLVRLLRLNGFDAEFALTGADALSRALVAPPDAVILDLHLSDDHIPGLIVLKSMRARHQHLPIIVATGWYLSEEHEAEARSLGVTDYLFKPLDESMVAARLLEALGGCREQVNQGIDIAAAAERTANSKGAVDGEVGIIENSSQIIAAVENRFIITRLPHLIRTTWHSFPTVWHDVILEQVEDTLLEFLEKVKQGIWPAGRSLDGHLRQAAWRNVRDQMQQAARRRVNEARYANEQPQLTSADEADVPADLERVLTHAHTDAESEALRRWIADESSIRIAEALGVSQLSIAEQLGEVKRFKDRIKKRARRKN